MTEPDHLTLIDDRVLTHFKDSDGNAEDLKRFLFLAEHAMIARGYDPMTVVRMGSTIRTLVMRHGKQPKEN